MPTVHRLGRRTYALGGYNGRGIVAGTVFGESMADLVLDRTDEREPPVPVTQPRFARLAGLKGKYIRAGAAEFHMTDARRGR